MLGDIELIAVQQQRRLRTQKINEKKKINPLSDVDTAVIFIFDSSQLFHLLCTFVRYSLQMKR